MKDRIEMNEEMMEQVNGGKYEVYDHNTHKLLKTFSFERDLEEYLLLQAAIGVDVDVKATGWFDNKDQEGFYPHED